MDLSRFTTCTYPLRDEPYPDAFRRLAATGLTRLDVWGRAPHFSPKPDECDPDQFEAAARAAGVTIANLGSYVGGDFDSDDPAKVDAEMAATQRVLELAKRFGCRTVRALPGHGEDPALIDRIAPHFRKAAEHAAKLGVYMGMENHKGSLAGDPDLALRLCEAVGSPWFGVLYEPCNLWHGKTDYKRAFDTFRDHIVHVHLKDGRWTDEGFQRTHLGDGEVDIPWCIAQTESLGYDGDYALEYEIRDVEEIDSGLPKWREYAARL